MKMTLTDNNGVIHQQFLLLAIDSGIVLIDVNTIIRIEAISNYSKIFFPAGDCFGVSDERSLQLFNTEVAG